MNLFSHLLNLWRTPDRYEGQPLKYAANQVGHFTVVGYVPALVGLPGFLIVSLFALWEWSQWRFQGADPRDGWEDWVFVALGVVAVDRTWVFAIAVALLLFGAVKRIRGRG